MAVKTRAQLKSENASDFPDNVARLISPADLRGQMDDVVDSALFPEDGISGAPGTAGDVRFVASIAAMRALTGLAPGSIIFVGSRMDQFICVNDATLGSDGGTVFIPDSELSAYASESIPTDAFAAAIGPDIAMEYSLAHAGLDFESFQIVVTDAGETIDVWGLHGHVMQPIDAERANCPQLPHIDTARGKFRDPYGVWTQHNAPAPDVRAGGIQVRYKYATSGLRLKRVTGPVFQLRWWPVVAVDEETGTQVDNSGKICWCANAAALAKADAVYIEKMYHYARCVEWPEGVELRGCGPGLSGFRVMDNMQHAQLLLTASADGMAADPSLNPLAKPATRRGYYDSLFQSMATGFYPASGARRVRISGIEFDGNIDNNMRIFTQKNAEYAYTYANAEIVLFNVPTSAGFAVTNQSARVIPTGMVLELHNVKMHGYMHLLLGNDNCHVVQTGLLELGNSPCNHFLYLGKGVYEKVRCFGYCNSDALRCDEFIAKSVEFILTPAPDVMYTLTDNYALVGISLFSATEFMAQQQFALRGYPYPMLSPYRVVVDHLFVDATGLDGSGAGAPHTGVTGFMILNDNFHIKSGKLRFGKFAPTVTPIVSTQGNNVAGLSYRNISLENLNIEYGSRAGLEFMHSGSLDGGYANANFRNITFEPRAATHMPNNPAPEGVSILLGFWRFHEEALPEPTPPSYALAYDGRDFDFSAAGSLAAGYVDITPPDAGAPVFRVWFNYTGSTAPSASGVTLVPTAALGTTPTTAQLAAAFAAAIQASTAASAYLTSATFNTIAVVGSFSAYHHNVKGGYVGGDVSHATGVTTSLRAYRRTFEPSIIGFERFIAQDPTYQYLLNLTEVGPHRDVTFTFKDCVFGSYAASIIMLSGSGGFNDSSVVAIKDRVHFMFEDCVLDWRGDATSWSTVDLTLYAGKFRNCRFRTPATATGVPSIAGSSAVGFETLYSEDSGVETWTPTAGDTFHHIQTKLFNIAKPGNIHLYPANAAAQAVWGTVYPTWRRFGGFALGGTGNFYQGLDGISEDRRAPMIRLNFSSALTAVPLSIGWSAAVSP